MQETEWTLAGELCRLASKPTLPVALFDLALIESVDSEFELSDASEWRRGGAETYICTFSVRQSMHVQKCILKAMVAASPASPPERQLEKWLMRRHRLSNHGINVPRLFGAADGVILEEFIEADAIEQLRADVKNYAHGTELQSQLENLCALVYEAGFRPLCILPNLRLACDKLSWIDFGEDLGEPRHDNTNMPNPRATIVAEIERYIWSSLRNPSNG